MNTTRYPTRRSSVPLTGWPELGQLSNRLQRMFGDWGDFADSEAGFYWAPPLDVEETADELVLRADMPGMTADHVSIELDNGVLTISGERARTEVGEDVRFHVSERRFGVFRRSISLPRTVDAEGVAAEFVEGVLTVHLPKMQEAKARKIAIRTGS